MERPILSLYFKAILLGLVILYASGQPSILSTIQPLSGELCPGTVTFTCNWLDAVSTIIDFLIDDTRLVRYAYQLAHTFPRNVTPVPSGFMAQISSVEFSGVNNKLNYSNFTISVHLDDLKSYQGQDISCGSLTERSNFIPIGNYSTRDVAPFSSELLNITLTAVYVGLELKLSEINVVWDDLTFFDDCYQNIRYIAKLTNQDMMQNGDCSNMTCSAKFLLDNEGIRSDIYFVTVTGSSDTQRISSGPIYLNTSVTNGFTIRNDTNCNQRIVCSSNNNDNCSVQYQESESSPLKSFEVYHERELNFMSGNLAYLEITKKISPNLTFIAQINYYTADNPQRKNNDLVGVGVTLMILGFIIVIVGSVVVVYWVINSIKKSSNLQHVFLWAVLHGMSWILAIVSLSLWISYGVVNDSGSCTSGPEEYIAIVATTMSVLLVVVSVMITGALFLVDFMYERKKPKEKKPKKVSYDKKYKLLFKNEYTSMRSNVGEVHKCECGAKFDDLMLKDLSSVVLGTKKKKCSTCPKNRCENCLKYAFRKQAQEVVQVCEVCYKGFEEEKERILKLPGVGLFEPVKQKYNDICYECEKSPEEKQEVENCKGCGQWVCDKCIVTKEKVYLQYSNTSEYVCRNCYALIKIMEGNLKPANEDDKVNDDVAHETQPEMMELNFKSEHKRNIKEVKGELPSSTQLKIMQDKGDKTEENRE